MTLFVSSLDHVTGFCQVGEATAVGIGAFFLQKNQIGVHSFVGGGSVVTKNVADHQMVVGIPAKGMLRPSGRKTTV